MFVWRGQVRFTAVKLVFSQTEAFFSHSAQKNENFLQLKKIKVGMLSQGTRITVDFLSYTGLRKCTGIYIL